VRIFSAVNITSYYCQKISILNNQRLTDCGLTALSPQIGYIATLENMSQLKK